ncbi:MAG: hypothetical protein J6P74_02015 [Paludibacteraceae bacterium]|nr:hypothetical protein [Paludibacteraceae bacterium]
MRKLFLFLCAALLTVMAQADPIVVTITQNDFPDSGETFTKDGVTVWAEDIDKEEGDLNSSGFFTTPLGNFTKIEVFATSVNISGEGWVLGFTDEGDKGTWTGNAASVSWEGNIKGWGQGTTTLRFTIEPAPEPEPEETITAITVNGVALSATQIAQINDWHYSYTIFHTQYYSAAPTVVFTKHQVNDEDITVTAEYLYDEFTGEYWKAELVCTEKTFIVLMGVAEPQSSETVVVLTEADYKGNNIFEKDGVTLTVARVDADSWYITGPGTFTNSLGKNFIKIEVTPVGGNAFIYGEGWEGDYQNKTWTGNAPTVSFNEDIQGQMEGFTATCTLEEPTGVENVQGNQVQSAKFFRDGQLLIEKNGKIYNAQGVEVR